MANPAEQGAVEQTVPAWRFVRDGREFGPVSLNELREMTAANQLPPSSLVWRPGMGEWTELRTIIGSESVAGGLSSAPGGTLNYYAPANDFVYAGFWLRVLAQVIDAALLLALLLTVVALSDVLTGGWEPSALLEPLLTLMAHAGVWLYYAAQEASQRQATVGKRLVGLKVTDTTGAPISFGHATGRHFAKLLSSILF